MVCRSKLSGVTMIIFRFGSSEIEESARFSRFYACSITFQDHMPQPNLLIFFQPKIKTRDHSQNKLERNPH